MTTTNFNESPILLCTCNAPPAVDLTSISTTTSTSNTSSCEEDVVKSRNDFELNRTLLKTNLQTFGWSHVLIDIPFESPSQSQIFNLFQKTSKKKKQECPSSTTTITAAAAAADSSNGSSSEQLRAKFPPHVKYHIAESGGEMIIEPKESLEISTANINKCITDDDDDDGASSSSSKEYKVIESWCNAMHTIAQNIRQSLDLPSHVLLCEKDNSDGDCDNDGGSKMIDLMRVFYYHQVQQEGQASTTRTDATTTNTTPIVLGSSPHTDWGSFTIVWQDDVGGLQTYCAACKKWNNVRTDAFSSTTMNDNGNGDATNISGLYRWGCVVHVGDMTSLALALQQPQDINGQENGEGNNTTTTTTTVRFPSPRHRVVSSESHERASLVYFGYPPSHLSLEQVIESLEDWSPSSRGPCLPHDYYYLLKNQSDGDGSAATTTSSKQYHAIKSIPLGTVVERKWQQVQR